MGLFYVLIYNLLSGAKEVYFSSLVQGIPPIPTAVILFVYVTLFFNLLQLHELPARWQRLKAAGKDVFFLNLTSMASWFSFFYTLKYLEPAISSTIVLSIGPVLTLVFSSYFRPQSKVHWLERFASLGTLSTVALLIGATWIGRTAVGVMPLKNFIIGMSSCLICSVSVVGNTIFSKRLNDLKWTPKQIMADRFFLMILIGALFWPNSVAPLPLAFGDRLIIWPLASLLGVIAPLYALQMGIQRCEPIIVSLLLSTAPLFILLGQLMDHRFVWSNLSLVGIMISIVFTLIGVNARRKPA
jgi:drug/metabolite transporter (DMT)-like permease